MHSIHHLTTCDWLARRKCTFGKDVPGSGHSQPGYAVMAAQACYRLPAVVPHYFTSSSPHSPYSPHSPHLQRHLIHLLNAPQLGLIRFNGLAFALHLPALLALLRIRLFVTTAPFSPLLLRPQPDLRHPLITTLLAK